MGPIKEICFFPFSVFFFLHLVYFFLMDRKVRTNWSNWRDVQPFFLPRSIFNACCIERSNPLKSFRTFNNFLEAHVNIIWSNRVHLSFCFGYNMHLEFTFQKKHVHSKYQKKSEPLFTRTSSSDCIVWLQSNTLYQRQVVFFQQSPGQLLQNYYCKQNCAFSDVPEQPWSVNGKLSSSNNLQRRFSMPTIPSNSLENKYNIKADIRNVKWFTQIYLKHCQRHNRPKG